MDTMKRYKKKAEEYNAEVILSLSISIFLSSNSLFFLFSVFFCLLFFQCLLLLSFVSDFVHNPFFFFRCFVSLFFSLYLDYGSQKFFSFWSVSTLHVFFFSSSVLILWFFLLFFVLFCSFFSFCFFSVLEQQPKCFEGHQMVVSF